MPGAAFGVFFLQLLVCIIQGLHNVNLLPGSTVEAVVGQNISLPCILREDHELKITIIEWRKNGETKLAVYSVQHGLNLFWPNVTVQIVRSSTNKTLGTYLCLKNVTKWDSGNYTCQLSSFPVGSEETKTSLIVKDVGTVAPENLTERIHFSDTPPSTTELSVHVNWTIYPNSSDSPITDSLVPDISVPTEDKTTRSISFTSATTPEDHSKTSQTFNFSTAKADTTLIRTTLHSTSDQMTEETKSHKVHPTTINSPVMEESSTLNSSTENSTSDQMTEEPKSHKVHPTTINSPVMEESSTLNSSTENSTSDQMTEETKSHKVHPTTINSPVMEESSTLNSSTENSTHVNLDHTQNEIPPDEKDTTRSHLVLIVVPVLTVVGVFGFLYWLQRSYIRQMNMERPPSFKPPPPPVKYSAMRQNETPTQFFPTSRCNSIADYTDNMYV